MASVYTMQLTSAVSRQVRYGRDQPTGEERATLALSEHEYSKGKLVTPSAPTSMRRAPPMDGRKTGIQAINHGVL